MREGLELTILLLALICLAIGAGVYLAVGDMP